MRGPGATVAPTSSRSKETFEIGLRSFINEARMLAQFDHPALVKVYRFWEANGTAYMVMPYYEGTTLKEELSRAQTPPAGCRQHSTSAKRNPDGGGSSSTSSPPAHRGSSDRQGASAI